MTNRRKLTLGAIVAIATAVSVAVFHNSQKADAAVANGAMAPAFSVVDSNGRTRTLAEFAGKTVVLEWTNADCPYVKKHYESGAMQGLQREATAGGVAWLSVISSAPWPCAMPTRRPQQWASNS